MLGRPKSLQPGPHEGEQRRLIVRDNGGQALACFYFQGARSALGYFYRRFSLKWEPAR
jgi:hypothetical protein